MAGETHAYVALARILRPRGVKGEVAAEILTDFPQRLLKLAEAFLSDGSVAPRRVRVKRCWLSSSRGGQAIFHFDDCDSVEAAEKLRGLEIQIPLSQRVRLPEGSYYATDLIGCEVFEAATKLGTVRDVQFTGAAPLLVLDASGRELLIPLAQDICARIDVAARRIEVALPEGLRDLNAS